jgi:hypothetical protein
VKRAKEELKKKRLELEKLGAEETQILTRQVHV